MKKKRWNSCNVLQVGSETREVWAFNSGKSGFVPAGEQTVNTLQSLPAGLVGKDWRILFQPKLNIAWLPAEKVFLRVLHLPVSTFDELLSMVDLQLEKISPLPVAQVVWTMQLLPHPTDNLQTVIVVIVERGLVQEFVGQLEGQGYLADRLEVPLIDQLLSTRVDVDGAWIYPSRSTGKFSALVAWWYGGELQSLGLLHVPAVPERGALLGEQLRQMNWAGELEGWLTGPPQWRLVADEPTAAAWQPMFQSWLGQEVKVIAPLTHAELATLTANRAAKADLRANLLPPDYSTRYHQEFIDRLWIRGLGSVLGVYVFCVMVYLAACSVQEYRTGQVEIHVRQLSNTYTNTLQLRDKMLVLQERQSLKYASLNCWKVVAELLPETLTLQTLDFKGGKTLTLRGSAPVDQSALINTFNEAVRRATVEDKPLFHKVDIAVTSLDPARTTVSWTFSAELVRGEDGQ